MKQLKISCWNLLEFFALDARAPPQLTSTVRADQTRIKRHATIPRTCWCHRRSLVASYSIVDKHHFGIGDSAASLVQSYVQLGCGSRRCASFSDSCQKKHFAVRALSTANACNTFLGLILRTVNSSSPTFLPPVLVYVKCSLRYHRPPTPCLTEIITSQADISRRTTTIMQPLLGKVSRSSNSF